MDRRKRLFLLLAVLVSFLFAGSFFLPVWTLYEETVVGGTVVQVSSLQTIVGYFAAVAPWTIVFYALAFLTLIVGIVFLFIALLSPSDDRSDRADKFYVFGCSIFIIGAVAVGMVALLLQSFILMAIALFVCLLYFLFIVLHYKFFTDY